MFAEVHYYLTDSTSFCIALISFVGTLSCGQNAIPDGVIEDCLIVDKKFVCVDLFFVGLIQDLK